MAKNILVAVTGLIPHFITQALWWFVQNKIKIDKLVIITTRKGEHILQKGDPNDKFKNFLNSEGILSQFCKEFEIEIPKTEIVLMRNESGISIEDVRKPNEFEWSSYSGAGQHNPTTRNN